MVDLYHWLEIRYRSDYLARNQNLLRELLSRIPETEPKIIIDLGSGLGSNFRFLRERLEGNQIWYFVDIDKEVLNHSLSYLSNIFSRVIEPSTPFILDQTRYEIRMIHDDFTQNPEIPTQPVLIVANALFDLISESQFSSFISNLKVKLLYFTINYNGMSFEPETDQDRYYIDLYNKHMRRDQDSGNAMGNQCANLMIDILNSHNFDTVVGASDWELDEDQQEVQLVLIEFMEEAIPEILPEEELTTFNEWISTTNKRIQNEDLNIIVKHDDILAIKSDDNENPE